MSSNSTLSARAGLRREVVAMITYGKYDESDRRTYSIELEECHENDVQTCWTCLKLAESELLNWNKWVGEKVHYSAVKKACSTPATMGFAFQAL